MIEALLGIGGVWLTHLYRMANRAEHASGLPPIQPRRRHESRKRNRALRRRRGLPLVPRG